MPACVIPVDGVKGTTRRLELNNVAQQLPEAALTEGVGLIGVDIQALGGQVKYAYRVDPGQGDIQIGHLLDDESVLSIRNPQAARMVRVINNAALCYLHYTCIFEHM